MTLKNDRLAYGSVAKWLHWIIALLILCAWGAIQFRQEFTPGRTPASLRVLQLHMSIGVTIGLFVALRIAWRLGNAQPAPPPGPLWEHLLARLMHGALYLFMIAMPITGYIGTGIATRYFSLFEIPEFKSTALFQWVVTDGLSLSFEQFEKPIDYIHKQIGGEILIWLLVGLHAAAALHHHFVRRDDVLMRMLPRGRGVPE